MHFFEKKICGNKKNVVPLCAQIMMKTVKRIFTILGIALCSAFIAMPEAYAEPSKSDNAHGARVAQYNKPVWGKKANRRTGLYTIKNQSLGNAVSFGVNAMYYYGDVDMLDQAMIHGFQPQNLSFGGALYFGYSHQLTHFANWRFSLNAGYLHGNDSTRKETRTVKGKTIPAGKGKFNSIFGELAAGIEIYPFPKAGFYIYAGLGLNVSYINYDFTNYQIPPGSTVSVLPMLPVEIGYNFYIAKSFYIGLSVSVHQGLMDMGGANLDAWPLEKTSKFQWGDGYFQIGLSFSYRWHNCEPCRIAKW